MEMEYSISVLMAEERGYIYFETSMCLTICTPIRTYTHFSTAVGKVMSTLSKLEPVLSAIRVFRMIFSETVVGTVTL